MDSKRILLIGGNFYPEPTGIGKYNGEMMEWLALQGFDCTIVTTYPYYPYWKPQPPYTRKWFRYSTETWMVGKEETGYVKVYRCPHYIPSEPSGKKRILLDLSFSLSALFKVVQLLFKKRYDLVITVAPPFHLGFLGVLYKRVKKAKFLYHIQDLQIEAARDLRLIKSGRALRLMFRLERSILRHADIVSSISEGMIRKIEEKAGKKVEFFPNWSNIEAFHPIPEKWALKAAYGFAASDKIVLYSGAIGEKQGLQGIIEAAQQLRRWENIRFVICGAGPYKDKLARMASDLDLQNVTFLPPQPLQGFNEFLNMADLHLILQKGGASDLVMPSKLTNILAVGGLSLVTADPGSSLYDLVEKYEIGLLVPSEDVVALIAGIENGLFNDHSAIHRNSRSYAENFLSRDSILFRYIKQTM